MYKILVKLATALLFGVYACMGYAEEPRYQAPPHRFDAAIKVNDITKYSINLMWINRTLDPTQPYLSSAKTEETLVNQLLTPALKWAAANPQAEVSLWFDSEMATRDAVLATQAVLGNHMHHDGITNLRLRDIRGLPIVKKNPDVFSDQTPIYFRVDILKPIFLVNAIENEHNQAAVFADLEVGDLRPDHQRMNKAELFDATTMRQLSKEGLLLNNDAKRVENQFFQMLDDKRMLAAIKYAVINANLLRACNALNSKDLESKDLGLMCGLGNAVYTSTFSDLFDFYKGTAPGVHIKVRPDLVHQGSKTDPWIDYDPKIHGYEPFGLYHYKQYLFPAFKDEGGDLHATENFIKFPFEQTNFFNAPARKVQVRRGRHHIVDPRELVHREPAGRCRVYHCELWD